MRSDLRSRASEIVEDRATLIGQACAAGFATELVVTLAPVAPELALRMDVVDVRPHPRGMGQLRLEPTD